MSGLYIVLITTNLIIDFSHVRQLEALNNFHKIVDDLFVQRKITNMTFWAAAYAFTLMGNVLLLLLLLHLPTLPGRREEETSAEFSQVLLNSAKFCQILPNSAKLCQIMPNSTQ